MPDKDENELPSLDEFGSRLDKARGIESESPARKSDGTLLGWGMRIASELAASLLIGAAIGYGFDRLFNTLPWCLLVGILLGFLAGLRNVMRAANEMDAGLDPGDKND